MDYILYLIQMCGIFAILSMSLNLINGYCGQFSLGHAGFWAVGAYSSAAFSIFFPIAIPNVLLFLTSCIIAFICSSIAGLIIGVPCLRLRGDYLAIATLGFGEIIRIIIMNMDIVGGPRGLTDIPKLTNPFWILFFTILTIIFMINLINSTHGRAIISIREDELAAESIGISTFKYKTFAFVVGAGFAGIAGALFAHITQFISPTNFTFMWSVIILLMIILGGMGSTSGAIIGAIILTLMPEILRFLGETISQWRMVVYSMLLIILMLIKPTGILGQKEINIFKLIKKI